MKLRNRKTGEIVEFKTPACMVDEKYSYQYGSLAELNDEWEDYEEPKEFWFVDCYGDVQVLRMEPKYLMNCRQSIGDYFKTKEEAEKAVEKLRAWKRLKDKGFRFNGWSDSPAEDDFDMIWFTMKAKVWDVETQEALDLLFGGEE